MKRHLTLLTLLLAACAAPHTPTPPDSEIVFITATPSPAASDRPTDEPLPFRDLSTSTPTLTPTLPPTHTPKPAPTFTPAPTRAAAPASPPLPAASLPLPSIPTAIPIAIQPVADVASAEQAVVDLVNQYRALNGLPALARSETIMNIARARSADMAARGYFGHNDPVTGAPLAKGAVLASGFGRAGENIYWSGRPALADFPATAVGWFMGSPAHRANILNSGYTAIGVGIAWRGDGWVLAQVFGG